MLSPGRNIVLIGLMGTGKSAVGRDLAGALGRPFVDTDAVVTHESGRSIRELFAHEGESGFRRREAEAVRHVSALRGQVIAVGGGAVLDPANVTALHATGDLIWLDASPTDLASRLSQVQGDPSRPLLAEVAGDASATAERLAGLQQERAEAYRRAAAHRIDTSGRDVQQVAAAVLEWARRRPGLLSREELRA